MRSEMEMMAYNDQDDKKTTTAKVLKGMETMLLREVAHIEKMFAPVSRSSEQAAEDARKAWIVAQKMEANKGKWGGVLRDVARLVTKRVSDDKLD